MHQLGDRYRILSPLGAGGMGEVFLAEDVRLERRVAIKLLPASIQEDRVARERLRREALAAAALDHPFICKVHEIGDADGRMFIVMEYVEGETLHAVARRGPLAVRDVIDIAYQLAQALDTAHRRNIIHRDLKPANVMLTPQRHVKVMDFGLAKQLDRSGGSGVTHRGPDSNAGTTLTDAGSRLGTPAYMSPEQVLGAVLDVRSDIFSLGVILFELAAGAHPFLRDAPAETMASILRDPPRQGPRDVESVNGFGAVVGRMLAKACAERHQTMQEVLVDLDALRERAWSTTSQSVVAVPAQPAERTPFVGREAEAAELDRALDRMLTGHGSLVLIGGEPGVGKTRLVRELLAKGHQRGCVSLTGHCYEMEGSPPFVPFVEIVEQTVRLVPQAARAAMGEFAAEIAAIAPSLRKTYSDIPPMPDVPAEQQRRLMFSGFLEYVRRGSQKSPGVFLFDDLHWADEPSIQLLQQLAPHLSSMRLLVVGTYRDVELDVKRPFAKMLESLLRQRIATRITLRRMNESGVQQMLAAMSGSAPPSGLAKAVFRETEGNPFFVEEVYQHLSEEGKLFDASGAWKADLRVDSIEVPEGVRLVIGRRLDRLGEQARKVLIAGAVIGRTFPLDLLQAVVDVPEDDVLDGVEEAERAQLVTAEASQRTLRYGFVHELIRTTLISGLSLPRRQRLHLRIADAIERLRAASLESHASVLAHHLYQAGAGADAQRTAKALALAGKRALAAAAFEEALETFDNLLGLELAEHDPMTAAASEHRGKALVALGRHDEAAAAFERALVIYGALGDAPGIERSSIGEANVYGWLGRTVDGVPALARGLRALPAAAARERAMILSWLAISEISPAHLQEAAEHLNAAVAISERLDDPIVSRRVLGAQAGTSRMCCDYKRAFDLGQRTLQVTPSGALWDRADALVELVLNDYYMGHFAACDEWLSQLEAVAVPAGHRGAQFIVAWVRLMIFGMRAGRLREFLARLMPLTELRNLQYSTFTAVAYARLYLGEVDAALDQLTAVVKTMPEDNWFQGMAEGNLFSATALAGQRERATALIPTVIPWLPATGRRNVQGAFYALDSLVNGLTHLGETDRCGALYPLTLDYIQTGAVVAALVVSPSNPQLAAALAADAAGLTERSREHFETALHQSREMPMRILEPTVLYWYGRAIASEAADRARGRAMIEEALTGFRQFEMPLHAKLAEDALRSVTD